MKNQPEPCLFASAELERPFDWRSHAASAVVHLAILALALLIPVAVLQKPEPVKSTTLYLPPPLKEYKLKITAPKRPVQTAVVRPKPAAIPPPVVRPPEVKPPPAPPEIRPAPVQQHVEVAVAPAPKPQARPAPAPQIHTGVFEAKRQAVAPQAIRDVRIGGFGDPNGVRPSETSNAPTTLARVGQFDLSAGADHGSGGRRGAVAVGQSGFASTAGVQSANTHRGAVVSGGFGDAEAGTGSGAGQRGVVRNGGFGDAAASAAPPAATRRVTSPAATPVEILYKPKPAYTQEARNLKIEGNVLVDVVFCASGEIRMVRIVHGLGHGLDEAAQQAVAKIKFRPATHDGAAVDTRATVSITFEVT